MTMRDHPITAGEPFPALTLKAALNGEVVEIDTATAFAQGRHVLFGLPGAFTPTCSAKHLPGYIENAVALRAKGVETIACLSVNDIFVMKAWAAAQNAEDILMLADGSALLTQALGLAMDRTDLGMGIRCQRCALVIEDGRLAQVFVEQGGGFEVSSAEAVLRTL